MISHLFRRTGETRGFAFVRFYHKDDAEDAMEDLDGRFEPEFNNYIRFLR